MFYTYVQVGPPCSCPADRKQPCFLERRGLVGDNEILSCGVKLGRRLLQGEVP